MDEAGLVVELLNLGVVGVNEINNLLNCGESFPFLLDEHTDRQALTVVRKERTRW